MELLEGKKWSVVEFRKIVDPRGNLTPIESGVDVPFDIARTYYIYDVPSGSTRAGHAHIALTQIYLALSGSFDVHLDDGRIRETITLNRPNIGILIKPGVWREIDNFSNGSVCFVLASGRYDEDDYIRKYVEFRQYIESTPAPGPYS